MAISRLRHPGLPSASSAHADRGLAPTLGRASKLDEFKPYLTRRWNQGCTNATQLHAEI